MENNYQNLSKLRGYFEKNSQNFESTLLTEAVNVKDKIDEILKVGNIDLVNNAHKLVVYIIDGQDEELQSFAKKEGIAWAIQSIALSFKLEWVQAIRRTLWIFIQAYSKQTNELNKEAIFNLEHHINSRVDEFLNGFFISYSTYKDSLIKTQQELVAKLSVPIIPINPSVGILPLIGTLDSSRITILEEKVLQEIGMSRLETLIMDMSGIAKMEVDNIKQLMRIIDSISFMGCQTILTGLRMEIARKITQSGILPGRHTKTLGTLQQALKEYVIN